MPLSKRNVAPDFSFGRHLDRHIPPHQNRPLPPIPPQERQSAPRTQQQQQQPSALDDLSYFYHSAKAKLSGKMREVDPLIGEYSHMREMPDAERALHTLRKIASCVKPIMRKRGWRVGTLSEFYPDQQNLLGLNVNRGQQILVRLRYPHDRRSFLPFEHALDTMLHELCHIVIGPHDHHFQALWQELRDEWETLTLKGYSGEGFLGSGRSVGGSNILPRDEMRRRARAEAAIRDKERKKRQATSGGGRKLGGAPTMPGAGIRDAVADAVIRRTSSNTQAVTDGCGTGTKAGMQAAADALLNGYVSREEMDDANALAIQQAAMELMAMDEERILTQLDEQPGRSAAAIPTYPQASSHYERAFQDPPSEGLVWDPINGLQPAPPPSRSAPPSSHRPPVPIASKPSSSRTDRSRSTRPVSRLVKEADFKKRRPATTAPPQQPPAASWECEICTLVNGPAATRCNACEVERPGQPFEAQRSQLQAGSEVASAKLSTMGWNCLWCGNFMEHKWWTCDVCGKMKDQS